MTQGDNVYKIVEIVGSSTTTIEDAIQNAISRSSETLRNLDWFEVREIRGPIEGNHVGWYQVKLGIGFRVGDGASASQE